MDNSPEDMVDQWDRIDDYHHYLHEVDKKGHNHQPQVGFSTGYYRVSHPRNSKCLLNQDLSRGLPRDTALGLFLLTGLWNPRLNMMTVTISQSMVMTFRTCLVKTSRFLYLLYQDGTERIKDEIISLFLNGEEMECHFL